MGCFGKPGYIKTFFIEEDKNMTKNKLVNSFKLFSAEECKRLASNLPDPSTLESDYHAYFLERGIDDSWFDVVFHAAKNNNRMKIAISAIGLLSVNIHGNSSIYSSSMNWGIDELEKKMRIFVPLFNENNVELCVSVGNIKETFIATPGMGYIWPAWASLDTVSESNFKLVNLDGTIIGKKLS